MVAQRAAVSVSCLRVKVPHFFLGGGEAVGDSSQLKTFFVCL